MVEINASGIHGADVLFWQCPAGHSAVTWIGATARCDVCPLTSEHTGKLISRGRAEQRQRDIRWLRDQARKSRAAREAGSDVTGDFPLLPARVLDTVAMMLSGAPIGDLGDD